MTFSASSSTLLVASSNGPSKDGVVGIFWDYESCPSPHACSSAAAVAAIQETGFKSGSVVSFNVYIDLNRHPKKVQEATGLRQQLHSSGVSVRLRHLLPDLDLVTNENTTGAKVFDCPGNGGKTVGDKMILVDLFAFALRNHPPATVVVISADPDLAYTLSLLRQRRFNVTLVSSNAALLSSASALRSQADACFTWSSSLGAEILSFVGGNDGPRIAGSVPSPSPNPGLGARSVLSPPMTHVDTASTQSISQVTLTSQISPLPSSSSVPVRDNPTITPEGAGTNTTAGRSFTRSLVPEHLHDLVTVLSKAVRRQGWPEAAIYGDLRHLNKRKWDNPTLVSTYIGEAVRLGIFVQSNGLSKKTRLPRTHYAVEETLKNSWG